MKRAILRQTLFGTIVVLLTSVLLSCSVVILSDNTNSNVSSQEMSSFQRVFMSSYYSNSGGTGSGARVLIPVDRSAASSTSNARATVTVGALGGTNYDFATVVAAGATGTTLSNYPETGQTSKFVVTVKDAGTPKVYDVTVTTSFSAGDSRQSYVEEYYVQDSQDTGTWTYNDPIVQGSVGSWTQNQSARVKMRLTFTDGTTRDETVVSNSGNGGPKFASFSVTAGDSLDLSQSFVPTTSTASTINYSSVVVYETHPATNPNFWFWQGSTAQTIVGIRYYTEEYANAGATLNATSISFERTVSSNTGTSGSLLTTLQTISGGSTVDTLAESVFREKVSWPTLTTNGAPNLSSATIAKYMQTRVINIAGQKDFYLQQLNTDYVSLSSWASGTKYTPTGAVDNVTATDSTALLFDRTTLTSAVSGAAPVAVLTSSLAGSSVYAQTYTSITDGTYTSPSISNAPTSNVMPSNTAWTFGGQSVAGSAIAYSPSYKLSRTGTVEAWIYINQMTDTMGIVHYGTNVDFSDEGYSLQGWSNNGQITMLVDWANGQYNQVLSSTLLKTKKWYHLVGVWDFTGATGTPYISLYINGKLDATTTSLNSTLVAQGSLAGSDSRTTNQVMVGSQLPSSYSAQYGYFGVNGKIVGVNISQTSSSATTILNNYNANKGNTGSW